MSLIILHLRIVSEENTDAIIRKKSDEDVYNDCVESESGKL